ncbi:MAG: cytochrome P450 [Pseudomonadota bacterium]
MTDTATAASSTYTRETQEAVDSLPLEQIDVSNARLYGDDTWRPYFARLRREDPVHYCPDSASGPFWSITRHADIMAVDTNHEVFSSEAKGISIADVEREENALELENFIAMDEPRHGQQRSVVSPSVAPRNLANMESLIRDNVNDILDGLPVGTTFDWVDHVAVELTARMLAVLFDFPMQDRRKLIRWSDITTANEQLMGEDAPISNEDRLRELGECVVAFTELWNRRKAQPEPGFDLVSMLANGEATKNMADNPAEFLGNLLLLIVGGNDTTRNTISGGVLALNEFPDQYDLLRGRVELIPNMVSEMVRWQTSVIHMRRTALVDAELGGKTISAGDKVVMWYLSGNRDESKFDNPDKLIIDRKNARQHVAFGFGVHRCMGNRLAEIQLRVLWEEIMQRYQMVEVTGPVVRSPNNFIRGIAELPVQLHAL